MSARVVWKGMSFDIPKWVKECQTFCRGKISTQPATAIQLIAMPTLLLPTYILTWVRPLLVAADGSTYVLMVINWTTCWLEAVPLQKINASTCAEVLISPLITRYKALSNITMDRGHQFTFALW
jgi:hypothetical protein